MMSSGFCAHSEANRRRDTTTRTRLGPGPCQDRGDGGRSELWNRARSTLPGSRWTRRGGRSTRPPSMSLLSTNLVDYGHLTPWFAPCQPPPEESSGEPRRSRAVDRDRASTGTAAASGPISAPAAAPSRSRSATSPVQTRQSSPSIGIGPACRRCAPPWSGSFPAPGSASSRPILPASHVAAPRRHRRRQCHPLRSRAESDGAAAAVARLSEAGRASDRRRVRQRTAGTAGRRIRCRTPPSGKRPEQRALQSPCCSGSRPSRWLARIYSALTCPILITAARRYTSTEDQ